MRAEEALRQSFEHLICHKTENGLVTIFQETNGERVAAEPFYLRFVPRDADGLLNYWGTVMVGSYDDLESALSAATEKYGAVEGDWMPIVAEDLLKGGHGPPLDR